VRHTDT